MYATYGLVDHPAWWDDKMIKSLQINKIRTKNDTKNDTKSDTKDDTKYGKDLIILSSHQTGWSTSPYVAYIFNPDSSLDFINMSIYIYVIQKYQWIKSKNFKYDILFTFQCE